MLSLYRALLHLYPPAYRYEYGQEMMAVLLEVQAERAKKGTLARFALGAREVGGLLCGAFQERFRTITGSYPGPMFSTRRISMRSEFRFPKATVVLMTIILAAILMAIDKAKAIQASIPYANPKIGPIQPTQFGTFPALLLILIGAGITAGIGWAILFALQRSGAQRLSKVEPSGTQRSGT